MSASYNQIGVGYSERRKPDPRISQLIKHALGDARSVVNVGAGTGSYEPNDRTVTAVEPSVEMISQRLPTGASVVQGYAEHLPFEENSFDAAMAILSLHHWTDKAQGCSEMRRVSNGPIVLLTFDPECREAWILDYFPEFAEQDDERFPKMVEYERWLGPVEITTVPIPHDCLDGFLHAYWRRPHAYLNAQARAAISSFWALEDAAAGLAKLNDDLNSGLWKERYGEYLERDSCDFGYRLVTTI